jgi:hypothetical protein
VAAPEKEDWPAAQALRPSRAPWAFAALAVVGAAGYVALATAPTVEDERNETRASAPMEAKAPGAAVAALATPRGAASSALTEELTEETTAEARGTEVDGDLPAVAPRSGSDLAATGPHESATKPLEPRTAPLEPAPQADGTAPTPLIAAAATAAPWSLAAPPAAGTGDVAAAGVTVGKIRRVPGRGATSSPTGAPVDVASDCACARPARAPAPSAAVSALVAARLFDSGRAQLDAGRAWTALAYFKKAIARSPKNPDAWFGLALARTDLRQTALARDACNKALALDPRHPGATLLLGFLAQQRRDTVTAKQLYARYLELEPDGAWASEVKTVIAQLP